MGRLLFKDEVYSIVGAAMEVHNTLGCGFLEGVYQEAMEIELADREYRSNRRLIFPSYTKVKLSRSII